MRYTVTLETLSESDASAIVKMHLLELVGCRYDIIDVRPEGLSPTTVSYDAAVVRSHLIRSHLKGTIDESMVHKLDDLKDEQLEKATIEILDESDAAERFHLNTLDILDRALLNVERESLVGLPQRLKEASLKLAPELSGWFATPGTWSNPDRVSAVEWRIAVFLLNNSYLPKGVSASDVAERIVPIMHGLKEISPEGLESLLKWSAITYYQK